MDIETKTICGFLDTFMIQINILIYYVWRICILDKEKSKNIEIDLKLSFCIGAMIGAVIFVFIYGFQVFKPFHFFAPVQIILTISVKSACECV